MSSTFPPQPLPGSLTQTPNTPPRPMSVGGFLTMEGNASLEARKAAASEANAKPVIQGLAAHVRSMWTYARDAKRQDVEPRMLQSLRQRRGEYDPEILSQIKQGGGSEIYMMVTSNKCRSAAAWIRDVMLGTVY